MNGDLGPKANDRKRRLLLFFLIPGLFIAQPVPLHPQFPPDRGQVVVVYDGDTVKVRFPDGKMRKIRLIGIDSPEMEDARETVRFMAHAAKRFAFWSLYRKNVRLSYEAALEDKYGRLLAYLATDDGGLFNERIIREGFAFVLRAFPFDEKLRKRFDDAEREARKSERGLWNKSAYPAISPGEAGGFVGRLACVRMRCSRLETQRSFIVLLSAEKGFEVLVPKSARGGFPGLETCLNREIAVTGLVEEFNGRIQIMLDMPMQLKIE